MFNNPQFVIAEGAALRQSPGLASLRRQLRLQRPTNAKEKCLDNLPVFPPQWFHHDNKRYRRFET